MGNQQASLENLFKIPFIGEYYHDGLGGVYSNKSGQLYKLKNIPHGGKTRKVYYRVKANGRLWFVHHLVLMEKLGRFLNPGESGNHLNADTTDNSANNLEISTHAEQVAHAVQNGLYCSGSEWKKARGLQEC